MTTYKTKLRSQGVIAALSFSLLTPMIGADRSASAAKKNGPVTATSRWHDGVLQKGRLETAVRVFLGRNSELLRAIWPTADGTPSLEKDPVVGKIKFKGAGAAKLLIEVALTNGFGAWAERKVKIQGDELKAILDEAYSYPKLDREADIVFGEASKRPAKPTTAPSKPAPSKRPAASKPAAPVEKMMPQYLAKLDNGGYFYVVMPESGSYSEYRAFIGHPGSMKEVKVERVERFSDGGTTYVRTEVGFFYSPSVFQKTEQPTFTPTGSSPLPVDMISIRDGDNSDLIQSLGIDVLQ